MSDTPPSQLDEAAFVARFADIFEHSPWVAEATFAVGIDERHDHVEGLHAAMVAAMRGGSEAQKLALIRAHPDLAGKLAAAKRLTMDSTAEQASAGLDALTDAERQRFTQLNEAYKARFGFPFILAVKGRTKAEILEAFETRLTHDQDTEFVTALAQIERIAWFRLKDRLPSAT